MTDQDKPVGVAFIGAGDVSILHAKAIERCPGARLVGLWNRTTERAEQRAAEFGCRRFNTPEALV
ncbi:MAG: Gfo/Idh/MocA family oxidoreductase, partial [Planctomycetes bacterium]|nr:Gfo/Idh/MocA family oxidoreductase [Planctomycetota bacterium]